MKSNFYVLSGAILLIIGIGTAGVFTWFGVNTGFDNYKSFNDFNSDGTPAFLIIGGLLIFAFAVYTGKRIVIVGLNKSMYPKVTRVPVFLIVFGSLVCTSSHLICSTFFHDHHGLEGMIALFTFVPLGIILIYAGASGFFNQIKNK